MDNTYKRQYRELSDETKKKIHAASVGRRKTALHRQHISQAMREYWKGVPNRPQTTTINNLTDKRENNEYTNQFQNETNM